MTPEGSNLCQILLAKIRRLIFNLHSSSTTCHDVLYQYMDICIVGLAALHCNCLC